MHGWVALLRGVNVGGRNPVPMAELRRLCEASGCHSVSTYIQSGNVILTSEVPDRGELAGLLERAINAAFGLANPVVVLRTFAELRQVATSHPFGADTSKSHVTFLAGTPTPAAIHSLASVDIGPDRFEVAGSDVYLQYPNGVQGSRLTGAQLERRLGVAATARNWRTVTRLVELTETGNGFGGAPRGAAR